MVVSTKRSLERGGPRRRCGMVEGVGKTLQNRVGDAHLQEVLVGGVDVVGICAGNARALAHVAQEVGIREPTGILRVVAIHHVGHGNHDPSPLEVNREAPFAVDRGHLLPFAQIMKRRRGLGRGNAKSHPVAASPTVEAEHESRPLRSAAVDVRIDAKRPMIAIETGVMTFDIRKSRPPHERAVTEHP